MFGIVAEITQGSFRGRCGFYALDYGFKNRGDFMFGDFLAVDSDGKYFSFCPRANVATPLKVYNTRKVALAVLSRLKRRYTKSYKMRVVDLDSPDIYVCHI